MEAWRVKEERLRGERCLKGGEIFREVEGEGGVGVWEDGGGMLGLRRGVIRGGDGDGDGDGWEGFGAVVFVSFSCIRRRDSVI